VYTHTELAGEEEMWMGNARNSCKKERKKKEMK
jgi:hypothetical protein